MAECRILREHLNISPDWCGDGENEDSNGKNKNGSGYNWFARWQPCMLLGDYWCKDDGKKRNDSQNDSKSGAGISQLVPSDWYERLDPCKFWKNASVLRQTGARAMVNTRTKKELSTEKTAKILLTGWICYSLANF